MAELDIILTDINEDVCQAFRKLFRHRQVTVEQGDIFEIDADAIVSPANSHGIMDGGLDRLLRTRFPGVEARVQREIDLIGGILPVGQAIVVETDDFDIPFLVCAPTMVVPSNISGTRNVHAAMLAALRAVAHHNRENNDEIMSLIVPGLGTGIGRMTPEAAASQMRDAFHEHLRECLQQPP